MYKNKAENNLQKRDFEDNIERFTCIYRFLLIRNSVTIANY